MEQEAYHSLNVLDPLQHSLRQRHQHPVSVNLSNVDMVWLSTIKEPLCHQSLQDPILVRETVHTLQHLTSSLDVSLKEEVDQMKVMPSMVVPIIPTLHTKGNSSRQQIRAWILTGRVSSPVIGGQRLTGEDMMLESTTSKVGVVFEWHD